MIIMRRNRSYSSGSDYLNVMKFVAKKRYDKERIRVHLWMFQNSLKMMDGLWMILKDWNITSTRQDKSLLVNKAFPISRIEDINPYICFQCKWNS